MPFDWSGSLKEGHRVHAADKFRKWAAHEARAGLHTVFAHSYGAEVVARAMTGGTRVDELVMLSAPVTRPIIDAAFAAVGVIDVRLRLDPVLVAASAYSGAFRRRVRQRMPTMPNVHTYVLPFWTVSHGATHDATVWQANGIVAHTGL